MVLKVNRLEKIHSDVQNINNYAGQSYILSGLATTENTPNDMDVLVSAGEFVLNGAKVSCAGGNVTLTAASAGLYKYVIIRANSSGVLSAVEDLSMEDNTDDSVGSPALGVPDYDPDNYVAIARVLVGDVTAITDANIKDLRKFNSDSTQIEENTNNILINLKMQSDNALLNTTSIDVMDLIDSPFKIVDLFTDSNGSNNTLSTGDTTAMWNIVNLSYLNNLPISADISEPGFETVVNWTGSYQYGGDYATYGQSTDWKTEGTYSYRLTGKTGSGGGGNGAQVKQANIDFTNIDYLVFDYNLSNPTSSGGSYMVGSFLVGATSVTLKANTTGTYVYDCSAITGTQDLIFRLFVGHVGTSSANGTMYIDNIRTFTGTEYLDSVMQSVSKSVGTGYNYAYVRPKLYEAIPSGATITCNVSLDGGSTFTAESDINEIIDISSLTDTGDLVVKMNLNTDGTVTSKISGWACLLW